MLSSSPASHASQILTKCLPALPRPHQNRQLSPRSSEPNRRRNQRTQHLHFRRAPPSTEHPSPLQLPRILQSSLPPQDLQLWHLHRLHQYRGPAYHQRRADAQATPALFLDSSKEPSRLVLQEIIREPWSGDAERVGRLGHFCHLCGVGVSDSRPVSPGRSRIVRLATARLAT